MKPVMHKFKPYSMDLLVPYQYNTIDILISLLEEYTSTSYSHIKNEAQITFKVLNIMLYLIDLSHSYTTKNKGLLCTFLS